MLNHHFPNKFPFIPWLRKITSDSKTEENAVENFGDLEAVEIHGNVKKPWIPWWKRMDLMGIMANTLVFFHVFS